MKKLTNKKSGFTLIEIIVVLIIVGVLAAIALPALFKNIDRSKGAEAIASLSGYKASLEGCVLGHVGGEGVCNAIAGGSIGNFTYTLDLVPADGAPDWTVTATSNNTNGVPTGTVVLTRAGGAAPTIVCSSTGNLAGLC